ncbi:unnamed protein product [Leptidea sinapis]|uniref:Uncharacterized protein n=1 Tax=Leptidea sinapis TaxID=189913 RepID=A0A5E4QB37_9NEOP|nr:unnamed protein product [Leptidea sinapis]
MKEARESGKYATIRNGKLIIRDKMESEKGRESHLPHYLLAQTTLAKLQENQNYTNLLKYQKPTQQKDQYKVNSNTKETSKH